MAGQKLSPFGGLTDKILGGLELKRKLISREQQMKRMMLIAEDEPINHKPLTGSGAST